MKRQEIAAGRDYAYREPRSITYLVLGHLAVASIGMSPERVRIIEHVRFGKFRAEWVGSTPRRIGVVHAMDLISPWSTRAAFLEQERQKSREKWTQIEKLAQSDPFLAAEEKSVRDQWSKLKDIYPDGYYYAAWDLLRRFGYTRTDSQGHPQMERGIWGATTAAAFFVVAGFTLYDNLEHPPSHLEVDLQFAGDLFSLALAALTAILTRQWIRAHARSEPSK